MLSSACSDALQIVSAPRLGANDDTVRVLNWLVAEGQRVEASSVIVLIETTKASVEVEAGSAGYVFPIAAAESDIAVGAPMAMITGTPERPVLSAAPSVPAVAAAAAAANQVITKSARALIEQHGLALDAFATLPVVRAADVEQFVASAQAGAHAAAPDDHALDAVVESAAYRDVAQMLTALRGRMRGQFNRHVPLGSLLNDRWALAQSCGFGEQTSVYDECLIQGDVRVGRDVWIGPFTVLDGKNATLTIGDHVDIGSGAHIYTHNAMESTLTGRRAPLAVAPVTIGSCCFIAPTAIIGPGTTIGDHSFVAAGSYVEGAFAPYSFIAGNPARKAGTVEIDGTRVRIRKATTP